jgi:hypothetical protein
MNGYNDLILLDRDFAVCGIVENYSELRWVRRYFSVGEFSLLLPPGSREITAEARYIYNPANGETAVIEEQRTATDASGKCSRLLCGRMLESLFDLRVINGIATVNGNAENEARALILKYALIGPRKIPKLTLGAVAGHTAQASAQYSGISLSKALYSLLGSVGLSPRLTYDYGGGSLVFTVAGGLDRTQEQTENSWAIFSSEYENVRSSLYVKNERDLRNFFYIAGEYASDGSRKVVTLDLTGGGERRELFVDAKDIRRTYKDENGITHTASDAEYTAMLTGRGYEAAAEHAAFELVEGIVAGHAPPVYREGYDLGDICDYTDTTLGIQRPLRITEITELCRDGVFSVSLKLSGMQLLTY